MKEIIRPIEEVDVEVTNDLPKNENGWADVGEPVTWVPTTSQTGTPKLYDMMEVGKAAYWASCRIGLREYLEKTGG